MRNELRFGTVIRVISVVALIIGASGCASQGAGGSKLDHDALLTHVKTTPKTVKVCNQLGNVMNCSYYEEHEVRAHFEHQMEMLRNDFRR